MLKFAKKSLNFTRSFHVLSMIFIETSNVLSMILCALKQVFFAYHGSIKQPSKLMVVESPVISKNLPQCTQCLISCLALTD